MKKVKQYPFRGFGEHTLTRSDLVAVKAGDEGGGTTTGGSSPLPPPLPPPKID